MKVAVLLVLVLFACSCATSKEEKKSEKESAEDYYHKGMKEYKEGDYEDATAAFKKAVEIDGKYFKAYYALGQSYEKRNKTKEAEEAYEDALKIDPKSLAVQRGPGAELFSSEKIWRGGKAFKRGQNPRQQKGRSLLLFGRNRAEGNIPAKQP